MEKLHFNSKEEFVDLFNRKTRRVTDIIVYAIEQAIINKKKSAGLFEVTFQDYEQVIEISLPKATWQSALESCLDFYHKEQASDEAIDTWKLLELVKVY
jgi:hypothetical protein